MLTSKLPPKIIQISTGLVLGILVSPRLLSPAPALSQNTAGYQQASGSWLVSESFNPPSRGAPGSAAAGGSRGCGLNAGQKFLTPLIPSDAMAFTLSEYPTFFWYVPEAESSEKNSAKQPINLRFRMIDENQNIVYDKKLSAPSAGIMSHRLSPEDSEPLMANKQYYWMVQIICDPENPDGNPLIDGWVERIPLTEELQAELANATEDTRPSIYAREGIWHEALTSLAQLRQKYPEDQTILSRWSEFLRSVSLGQFIEEPLISPGGLAEPKPSVEMSQSS